MSESETRLKKLNLIGFQAEDRSTWPLQKLRLLIRLKPTKACPTGFCLYAVREHDGTYWALRYKARIPVADIDGWMYAPVAEAKRFTPKIFYKENEE